MDSSTPSAKRSRVENGTTIGDHHYDEKDAVIASLRAELAALRDNGREYFATKDCVKPQHLHSCFPVEGMPAGHAKERILQQHELDNKPRLNTSSYVNVVQELEEAQVALKGLSVNLADSSVYPASVRLHDTVVNMIAKLWNCPEPQGDDYSNNHSGAGTVGSTEACLLAGLALKFRWRKWYQAKHNMNHEQVLGVVPNIVISSCFQAAWEKFFRYFDVTPRFIKPTLANKMRIDPSLIPDLCDEQTIGVVGILGNHYNGAYDPIWDMDKVVEEINKTKGTQIGIHVDAASGGFIAPFQDDMPPFDFRLKNVLSISASGHKFGESCCGTGWLVFRHRQQLAEHIAVSVTYLGGQCDSMTLNFSRPATAVFVQYYKFLRLGKAGYKQKVDNQMAVAKFLRDHLKSQTVGHGGKEQPRYEMVDGGDTHCLPVVGARMNPTLNLGYNDIDLQHAMAEYHWYVSGYSLTFENFAENGKLDTLCSDIGPDATMFRIVVKSNLTMYLAEDLNEKASQVVPLLDKMKGNFQSVKRMVHRRASERIMMGGTGTGGSGSQKTMGHAAC